jgi:hypothetical protein
MTDFSSRQEHSRHPWWGEHHILLYHHEELKGIAKRPTGIVALGDSAFPVDQLIGWAEAFCVGADPGYALVGHRPELNTTDRRITGKVAGRGAGRVWPGGRGVSGSEGCRAWDVSLQTQQHRCKTTTVPPEQYPPHSQPQYILLKWLRRSDLWMVIGIYNTTDGSSRCGWV